MYRVLIIDDEPFIVKGLSELIDWASLGCIICGTSMNGLDGVKLINELDPDIVVSDIVMPGKTGLEIAEFVNQNHKGIVMILLSGFDEFTYAKEAIKYGVFDYLLKPTDKDEVMNVIRKAVQKIEQTRVIEKNYEDMESVLLEGIPIIEHSLLHDIVFKGIINNHHIDNFQLTFGKGAIITIQGNDDIQENHKFERVDAFLEQLFKSKNIGTKILANSNQIIILPTFSSQIPTKVIKTRLQTLAENILDYFFNENIYTFSIGIGGIYTSLQSIHSSYLESLNALTKSFFVGKGKVHLYEEVNMEQSKTNFSTKIMGFIETFEEWNVEKLDKEFDIVFKELKRVNNKQLVINHSLELLIKLGFIATKWDKEYSMSVGYEQLEKCKTFEELAQFMKKTCFEIKNHLYEKMNQNNLGIVQQARQIIEYQYQNPDLSAQYIADQLNVNVSYLSRLFKKETGENLSNFVTDKRIQMAQKLFETTDLKASEVAAKVGYTDPKYFSQVFKKVVQITPTDFKKRR